MDLWSLGVWYRLYYRFIVLSTYNLIEILFTSIPTEVWHRLIDLCLKVWSWWSGDVISSDPFRIVLILVFYNPHVRPLAWFHVSCHTYVHPLCGSISMLCLYTRTSHGSLDLCVQYIVTCLGNTLYHHTRNSTWPWPIMWYKTFHVCC